MTTVNDGKFVKEANLYYLITKKVGGGDFGQKLLVVSICIETKMCHFVTEKLDGEYLIQKQGRKMKTCDRDFNFFRNL